MHTATRLALAVVAAAGIAATLAPVASADSIDPNTYYDRTSSFQDVIQAIPTGSSGGKYTIVSPFGTTQKIECRGDGHYVSLDCRQWDGARWHHLEQPLFQLFPTVFLWNPIPS